MSKSTHREKSLLSVAAFAKKKKVSRQAVYLQIKNLNITPVLIGMDKDTYIDWNDYRDYIFDNNFKRR